MMNDTEARVYSRGFNWFVQAARFAVFPPTMEFYRFHGIISTPSKTPGDGMDFSRLEEIGIGKRRGIAILFAINRDDTRGWNDCVMYA